MESGKTKKKKRIREFSKLKYARYQRCVRTRANTEGKFKYRGEKRETRARGFVHISCQQLVKLGLALSARFIGTRPLIVENLARHNTGEDGLNHLCFFNVTRN